MLPQTSFILVHAKGHEFYQANVDEFPISGLLRFLPYYSANYYSCMHFTQTHKQLPTNNKIVRSNTVRIKQLFPISDFSLYKNNDTFLPQMSGKAERNMGPFCTI